MVQTLLTAGLACCIAAIVGGGLKILGYEIPVLTGKRSGALVVFGAACLVAAFALQKPDPPSDGKPKVTGVELSKRSGKFISIDPDKGTFTVDYTSLDMHYDGEKFTCEAEIHPSFPGCPSCLTQFIVMVGDTAYRTCLYDGSANSNSAMHRTELAIPAQAVSAGGDAITVAVALGSSCNQDVLAGRYQPTGPQTVGSIHVAQK
jgi:hypothetical protein